MAAELKEALGVVPVLAVGRGGIFQIRRDGALVYDKAETGRFPHTGEAVAIVRGR